MIVKPKYPRIFGFIIFVLTAKGRADIVLKMPKGIYITELKMDDTAENALAQINKRGYAVKYATDGRPITKVGMSFSSAERNITSTIIERDM